ncbi:hypothetical protein GCM10007304_07530 [Rhodococcoides trifolii]|uniref:Rv3651-like N-terminal domain-containing protein n=1 Tax=Rhodococcoides trifolii TaxID=908250 RepID=A0A917FNP4_9NOCA|nr:GAF domain-containing protein [Rhodococcus trifolii]GGF96068.1 hypothetical protein GCM10007304_07530 [Rhodococcus trifolii]
MSGVWIFVETLCGDPAQATVVGLGERDKEWASLTRAVPSKGAYAAAVPAITRCVETASNATVAISGTDDCIVARPALGPQGTVHGVVLWHGPADAVPASWPAAAGFDWSSETREVRLARELRALLGLDDTRPSITMAEAFQSVIEFDDGALGFMSATLRRASDNKWIGSLTVRTGDGPMPVRTAMRSLSAPDESYWRAVTFESRRPAVPSTRLVESLALEALSRNSDTAVALIDLEKVRIVRWITEPIPNIAWKGVRDQRDTPHPDDVDRIVTSIRTFYRGSTESDLGRIRLRRLGGGWTVVDARATLVSVPDGPGLLLAEFRTIGFSDDPDPVPPTDTGYQT